MKFWVEGDTYLEVASATFDLLSQFLKMCSDDHAG
jgi:hypothetical protein